MLLVEKGCQQYMLCKFYKKTSFSLKCNIVLGFFKSALAFFSMLAFVMLSGCGQHTIKSTPPLYGSISIEKQLQLTFGEIKKILKDNYPNTTLSSTLADKWADSLHDSIDKEKILFLQNDVSQNHSYFDGDVFTDDRQLINAFSVFSAAAKNVEFISLQLPEWVVNGSPALFENNPLDYEVWSQSMPELESRWKIKISRALLDRVSKGDDIESAKNFLLNRYQALLKYKSRQLSYKSKELFFNALLNSIDSLTAYYSPIEKTNVLETLDMVGLGMVLKDNDGDITVIRSLPDGPADKKVLPGDIIIKITEENGESINIRGVLLDDAVAAIRGKLGSKVTLAVLRNNHIETVVLTRDRVKVAEQRVTSRIEEFENKSASINIGIISIPSFYIDFQAYRRGDANFRSTARDLVAEINHLTKNNVSGVVIDLLNNSGGALQEGIVVSDLFLPRGDVLQLKAMKTQVVTQLKSKYDALYQGPLVIAVNNNSAGAAEIFAGAVQDYNRGLIVGEYTFGMGNIYSLKPLSSGGSIKYIDSRMYRPSGFSFYPKGVQPDILMDSEKNNVISNNNPVYPQVELKVDAVDIPRLNPDYDKNKIYQQSMKRTKAISAESLNASSDDRIINESVQVLLDMITSE